jgi:hypothetical protein
VAEALAMIRTGLSFLAQCEAPALPVALQAEVLTSLEGTEARLTAVRARMLTAFCATHGYEADGQFGPKPWLRAFTRITRGAAAGAMAWMRRLQDHPLVAAALASEGITASWAREICAWTDRLPPALIEDADQILLAAAAGGADLPDLAALAWEMIERVAAPDIDGDGFADRALWLDKTLAGTGRLAGDLTPACAAAVSAVLDALSAKAGPEDTRTLPQRRHDALDEACQRLIAAGMLPGRDGQPLHVYAHMDLATLAGLDRLATGRSPLETGWGPATQPTTAAPGSWCPTGPDAEAATCDATVVPVVTGDVDWAALDDLTGLLLRAYQQAHHPARATAGPVQAGYQDSHQISPALRERLRQALLQQAVTLLSGPSGLVGQLRTSELGYPYNGHSQPLDLGQPTSIIPAALRRAVTLRDGHCRFPGCRQRPAVCQVHHFRPRADGGPTSLGNLGLFCRFHHLIAIHRWGWTVTLHPDGTTTATSPDGRMLTGHSPPRWAA